MRDGSKIRRRVMFVAAGAIAASVTVVQTVSSSAGAAPQAGVTKIQHVVVLMQENRSYDSYYGALHNEGQPASPAEPTRGNPNPVNPGTRIQPFLTTAECTVADLNHSWNGTHQEWNVGRMNGFTAANIDPADPSGSRTMGYFDQSTLSFYYKIANQFSIADHYFASVLTQTFPNRFYLLTGTSFGHIANDLPPAGGYKQKTVFQLLDEARPKVSWKIYLASFQVEELFSYVQHHTDHIATIAQYKTDAANGTLPQVSFVESDPFGNVNQESDEHPPANVQVGEKFTHDIIQSLVTSPDWSSSAMFLTYDEHGGYYDHVAPPAAPKPDNIAPMLQPGDTPGAFDRYGIRVPAIVISPYARHHFVSHTVYDHTSILHFIETRFGLPTLTLRDKAADPMLGMFDFTHAENAHPSIPAAPVDPAGKAACRQLHP
jgi:phospholipase C